MRPGQGETQLKTLENRRTGEPARAEFTPYLLARWQKLSWFTRLRIVAAVYVTVNKRKIYLYSYPALALAMLHIKDEQARLLGLTFAVLVWLYLGIYAYLTKRL